MQQVALGVIIAGIAVAGCDHGGASTSGEPTTASSEKHMPSERIRLIRERVPETPIIVLVKEPDPNGRVLDVQDYVIDGENVLPIFSSKVTLTQSLGGTDLGRPTIAISRPLLGSVLKGSEVFLLDPRLPSQLRFTAAEYREAFPEPFVSPTTNGVN